MPSNKKTNVPFTWRESFNFSKDFFVNGDSKLTAWTLLIGSVICVIGLVALINIFSWWFPTFWAALTAKALTPFLVCMAEFAAIAGAYMGVSVLQNYLTNKLSILWRNWLTTKMIDKLFNSENNYLDLKRFSSEVDNVAQRIQHDIERYVSLTLSLSMDFLKSTLSLGTFMGTLWVIGGTLSFTLFSLNLIIPGYLVWAALTTALVATIVTYYIGKPLSSLNKKSEQAEADLRQELAQLNQEAENIAEEHAEHYYKTTLSHKINDINKTATQKLDAQTRLLSFQNFYAQLSEILPYLLAAPLYFAGLFELGQLMQVSVAFGEVSNALSWFVNSYQNLADYKTSTQRIIELQNQLERGALNTSTKNIFKKVRDKTWIKVKNLRINQPQANESLPIIHGVTLRLHAGEHVLLQGKSGIGKSTFFKVISGTWPYGAGKVSLPAGKTFYFLPQKPTLPHDTLKAVLAYPEPTDTYTDEQYRDVLNKIGGMSQYVTRLEEKHPWSSILSGGQQQRISFVRALLKKPDWLFLDEATSALDEESEEHVYTLTKTLKDTTIVSIAHRSTVQKHHHKIVFFKSSKEGCFEYEESPVATQTV